MRWVRTMLPWVSMTVTATGTFCFTDSASTRSAMSFAMVSKSMSCASFPKRGRWAVRLSAPAREAELSHGESESVFRIAGLLKSLLQKHFDSLLGHWPLDGGHAGIPARSDFDVGRQVGFVHEALGVGDRPLIERSDPGCKCVHETGEFGIR